MKHITVPPQTRPEVRAVLQEFVGRTNRLYMLFGSDGKASPNEQPMEGYIVTQPKTDRAALLLKKGAPTSYALDAARVVLIRDANTRELYFRHPDYVASHDWAGACVAFNRRGKGLWELWAKITGGAPNMTIARIVPMDHEGRSCVIEMGTKSQVDRYLLKRRNYEL